MIKHQLAILINYLKQNRYKQNAIVEKLNILGVKIAVSSYSVLVNLKKNEAKGKTVSIDLIKDVVEGLEEIIKSEKGVVYDKNTQTFISLDEENWKPLIIKMDDETATNTKQYIIIHEKGRLSVSSKINLVKRSQKDFVELGVRLKSFSSHFFDENEDAYKAPIINKLNEGLNFRCFMLNPRGRFAADYFMDRAKVQPEEKFAFEEMKQVLERLKVIRDNVNAQSKKGKMEIYLMNSYPYFHASVSDGDYGNGKMYVAQYLYGISRANSPVFEFTKKENPIFYKKYWNSIQKTISKAIKVED
jgi:hypothetical protein